MHRIKSFNLHYYEIRIIFPLSRQHDVRRPGDRPMRTERHRRHRHLYRPAGRVTTTRGVSLRLCFTACTGTPLECIPGKAAKDSVRLPPVPPLRGRRKRAQLLKHLSRRRDEHRTGYPRPEPHFNRDGPSRIRCNRDCGCRSHHRGWGESHRETCCQRAFHRNTV